MEDVDVIVSTERFRIEYSSAFFVDQIFEVLLIVFQDYFTYYLHLLESLVLFSWALVVTFLSHSLKKISDSCHLLIC